MATRTERTLSYEEALGALLDLIGSPVTVTVTPVMSDLSSSVARMTGLLHRGERRRLTLGAVPEDPQHEVIFFALDWDRATGFAVSKRTFGGARVERDVPSAIVSLVVGSNEITVQQKIDGR